MTESFTSWREANQWQCLGCGRPLGFKDELAIVVMTKNGQTVVFIPKVVIGKCKCGLATKVEENKITFYVYNDTSQENGKVVKYH